MRPIAFISRLLLASVVASGAAGFLTLILLLLGSRLEHGGGIGAGDALFAFMLGLIVGGFAMIPAVALLTVPTMLVGGFLWYLAGSLRWARRKSSFAAAGALLGGLAYPMSVAAGPMALLPDPGLLVGGVWLALATFLIAGACSGLVFRSTMFALAGFFEEEAEEEDESGQWRSVP